MLWFRKKFVPFENAAGAEKLVLSKEQYYFLVNRQEQLASIPLEDGGFVTVNKKDSTLEAIEIYTAPPGFRRRDRFEYGRVQETRWFQLLLEKLSREKQKIGLVYHTHPFEFTETYKQVEAHGVAVRNAFYSIPEKNLPKDERIKFSQFNRELGDLVIEKVCGQAYLYGFTPLNLPDLSYNHSKPPWSPWVFAQEQVYSEERASIQRVKSIEILVPELELGFSQ